MRSGVFLLPFQMIYEEKQKKSSLSWNIILIKLRIHKIFSFFIFKWQTIFFPQFNYNTTSGQCDLLSSRGSVQNVLSVTGPKVCGNSSNILGKFESFPCQSKLQVYKLKTLTKIAGHNFEFIRRWNDHCCIMNLRSSNDKCVEISIISKKLCLQNI